MHTKYLIVLGQGTSAYDLLPCVKIVGKESGIHMNQWFPYFVRDRRTEQVSPIPTERKGFLPIRIAGQNSRHAGKILLLSLNVFLASLLSSPCLKPLSNQCGGLQSDLVSGFVWRAALPADVTTKATDLASLDRMPILDQFLVSCLVAIRVCHTCLWMYEYSTHARWLLVFLILQGLLPFMKEGHHIRSTVSSIHQLHAEFVVCVHCVSALPSCFCQYVAFPAFSWSAAKHACLSA